MRRVKRILSYVLVLSMCFTLFFIPIPVNAVGETYFITSANLTVAQTNDNTITIDTLDSISEVRGTILYRGNAYNCYLVSSDNFTATVTDYNGTNRTLSVTHTVRDGLDFYSARVVVKYLSSQTLTSTITTPIYTDSLSNGNNSWQVLVEAYNYTFGSGAVDPEPPGPTYGRVADVEYATRIAGSGLASGDNIDRIVWNQSIDTNGNDLPTGARVQIRAIPGKYVGNTANDVLNKTYVDFILDHSKQLIIVDIIASRGVYETKWSEVVDHFGFFPYSWVPNIQYLDNEYFKMGWIYQIRLQIDDYYSDWQNIYTATGSGASESQTITDSDELTQQLVQDIKIVNQLNNTTTTNWYINETTINNSEYTENTNGKPWWAYLLEAILSLFQIGDGEQQTINNTNNLNIDLNDKLNEYNEIEDQQLNNLDTNLEAIEVESDMLENNKFVGSANWVAQQYTRMTNGTIIGSLIGFSLLFGLALIFIGKIR